MVDSLTLFFGKKRGRPAKKGRKVKKSPGRKPKRGHGVRRLLKSQAYITVGGRRRKLYRGKNGGLYYRTRSGRHYVPAAVLRRKKHMLSPKRGRKSRSGRKSRFGALQSGPWGDGPKTYQPQVGVYNRGAATFTAWAPKDMTKAEAVAYVKRGAEMSDMGVSNLDIAAMQKAMVKGGFSKSAAHEQVINMIDAKVAKALGASAFGRRLRR